MLRSAQHDRGTVLRFLCSSVLSFVFANIRSVLALDDSVAKVKMMRREFVGILAAKRVGTVEDLLYYLPFRYEDRLNPRSIAELRPGEMASVIGEVRGSALLRTRRGPL